jgi:hypothetical protein
MEPREEPVTRSDEQVEKDTAEALRRDPALGDKIATQMAPDT